MTASRQTSTPEVEEGIVVAAGSRTQLVVAQGHSAFIRLPKARFGASGVLVLTGGVAPVEIPPQQAVSQENGRLLFRLPVQKGRRYTLVIRGNGPDQPVLVAADFSGSIDSAKAQPKKAGPCDSEVKVLRPAQRRVKRKQAVALGRAEHCPVCGGAGHGSEGDGRGGDAHAMVGSAG